MRKLGVALDIFAVLVFVGIGRSVHTHGLSFGGMASTAWPFMTGLAIGWCVSALMHRPLVSIAGGIVVLLATVTIGMTLRVLAAQGTAFAFVLVALGFLGFVMCGWRCIFMSFKRLRTQ
jgi:hypothetical protein